MAQLIQRIWRYVDEQCSLCGSRIAKIAVMRPGHPTRSVTVWGWCFACDGPITDQAEEFP